MHYPKALTPLHIAAGRNTVKALETIKQLCTNDNVNDTASREYLTPLHCAALSEGNSEIDVNLGEIDVNVEIVLYLLNKGCDINQKNAGGDSALFVAALAGNEKIVTLLLLKDAEVDQARLKSSTAYLEKRYPKILKLLQNPSAVAQSRFSWQSYPENKNSLKQRIPHNNIINIEMISLK